jgi:hypothetical protein
MLLGQFVSTFHDPTFAAVAGVRDIGPHVIVAEAVAGMSAKAGS